MNEYEYRFARQTVIAIVTFLFFLITAFLISDYMDISTKIEACLKNPQFGFCNDISGRRK